MTAYMRIVSIFLKSTFLVLAFLISLFVVFHTVLWLLPEDRANDVEHKVYSFLNIGVYPGSDISEAFEEEEVGRSHFSILAWLYRCAGGSDAEVFPRDFSQLINGTSRFGDSGIPNATTVVLNVPPVFYRLAMLSDTLSRDRMVLSQRLSDSYRIARLGAFSSIIIGFLTTVMVGLSSTELGKQSSRIALAIRITALILPALGTAVAAMTAFYDPSGNLARQLQSFSGLQQLQTQISTSVWKKGCPNPKAPEDLQELDARIDAWAQRLQELLAVAGDTRSQAASQGATSSGGASGQSGGSGAASAPIK